jgi:predicted RNA-binding protein with PUA-like domain
MHYWLVKQEPEDYSWAAFKKEGHVAWTGVRNFQARNYLRAMKERDRVLYYHSGAEKQIVGIAKVVREAYPDPTAKEGDWSVVDLEPLGTLKHPVLLNVIKGDPALQDLHLVRQSRLSVMPVTAAQFQRLLALGETNPEKG